MSMVLKAGKKGDLTSLFILPSKILENLLFA
jgi:hypothetical protein